jgi:DNA-binding NtrC family response regulator
LSKKVDSIAKEALAILMNHDWPGNIRELENVIERAIILTKGPQICPEDLPEFLIIPQASETAAADANHLKLKDALKSPEKELIVKALEVTAWNRNDTAKTLGINRTTLYKKMQKYGLLKSRSNERTK